MDSIPEKINGWISDGKDARSAHWQGALEKIMELVSPVLEPGKLIPVHDLTDEDLAVFQKAFGAIDLSPGLVAAFLPPAVAGAIMPPESAAELQRIDTDKPSYKILIARPGEDMRLMAIEISAHATRPGADIFQSGALLGSYEYQTRDECLEGLTKVVRTHMWEKEPWPRDGYRTYTMNWFEKVLALGGGMVPVEEKCSYLHSPTRINGTRIDAIFTLIQEALFQRLKEPDLVASLGAIADSRDRSEQLSALVQEQVTALLNVMRENEIVDFTSFSDREADQFKQEFSGTVRQLARQILETP